MNNSILHTFIYLILYASATYAQTVEAKLDTHQIKIGQHARLTITYSIPTGSRFVAIPALRDTITRHIEIVGNVRLDTLPETADSKQKHLMRVVTITSFDSGMHVIPPFHMLYEMNGDTIVAQSDTLFFKVLTVPADTAQPIKDIKAPWRAPITFRDIAPYLFGGILFLIVLLAAIYIWQRRRKGLPIFPTKQEKYIDPYDEVVQKLSQLQKQKIWQQGQVKTYYSLLADALRRYIERQYQIRAMEMTTTEILQNIGTHEILQSQSEKLQHILTTADMVKFARFVPVATEHEHCLSLAFEFVEATRPLPSEQATTEQSVESQTSKQ